MNLKCKHCGNGSEFITQPNSYEVWAIVNNRLEYQHNEFVAEELKLYCRDCSEELKGIQSKK